MLLPPLLPETPDAPEAPLPPGTDGGTCCPSGVVVVDAAAVVPDARFEFGSFAFPAAVDGVFVAVEAAFAVVGGVPAITVVPPVAVVFAPRCAAADVASDDASGA